MNTEAAIAGIENEPVVASSLPSPRIGKKAPLPFHYPHHAFDNEPGQRHAELFYLQKQIQSQTPMMIVLADGTTVEGHIEWYDRKAIKIRGREKVLIYKSAIKYMYKAGENGPGI